MKAPYGYQLSISTRIYYIKVLSTKFRKSKESATIKPQKTAFFKKEPSATYSFLSMDKAAITRNATPVSHEFSVMNQTTRATTIAGTRIKNKRTTTIITNAIMIKPISPKIS